MNELLLTVAVVLVPINWAISVELLRLSRKYPDVVTLRERSFTAIVIAVTVTALVVLAILTSTTIVDPPTAVGLRRLFLIVLSAPAVYWFWLYRRG